MDEDEAPVGEIGHIPSFILALFEEVEDAHPPCGEQRRSAAGTIVATCSYELGHSGPHTDVHEGRRW